MELYKCTGGEAKNCADDDEIEYDLKDAKFVVLNNQIRFDQNELGSASIV